MEKLVQQTLNFLSTIPRPKNWVLKLISFLLAIFLWYFVVGEDKVDMTVSVPVEIVNLPRDLVISNQFRRQLDVTVSGQRSLIRNISSHQITRSVDLSKEKAGKVVIQNDIDSIDLPWGISALRVQPSTITLLIERLVEKNIPITPQLDGEPAEGYTLIEAIMDPPSIAVSGPKSILAHEEFLVTKIIDISGLTEPISQQVTLDLSPALAELLGDPVITAHLNIGEALHVRQIDLPITLVGVPDIFAPLPSQVTIRAEFPMGTGEKYSDTASLFTAVARTRDLPGLKTAIKVDVDIDEEAAAAGVRILDITPEKIILEVPPPEKIKEKPAP